MKEGSQDHPDQDEAELKMGVGDKRRLVEHEEETVKSALWPSQAAAGGVHRVINMRQRMKTRDRRRVARLWVHQCTAAVLVVGWG